MWRAPGAQRPRLMIDNVPSRATHVESLPVLVDATATPPLAITIATIASANPLVVLLISFLLNQLAPADLYEVPSSDATPPWGRASS